jgi:hypothetical protein
VAASNCQDYALCQGISSCRLLRPGGTSTPAEVAWQNQYFSSAVALYRPGTHTVLMRLEAVPQNNQTRWDTYIAQQTSSSTGSTNLWAAFKVDLGRRGNCLPTCRLEGHAAAAALQQPDRLHKVLRIRLFLQPCH